MSEFLPKPPSYREGISIEERERSRWAWAKQCDRRLTEIATSLDDRIDALEEHGTLSADAHFLRDTNQQFKAHVAGAEARRRGRDERFRRLVAEFQKGLAERYNQPGPA